MSEQACADCGATKPVGDFYRHKNGTLYNRCKPCHYERTQRWRTANKAKVRERERERYPHRQAKKIAEKRLRKYGLSSEEFVALIRAQAGKCPICQEPLAESTLGIPSGDWSLPSIDHCHDTGAVRGVLHRRCNLALEFLLTEEEAARARDYLRGTTT